MLIYKEFGYAIIPLSLHLPLVYNQPTMSWKWSNFPLPEAYLAALLIGAILQFLKPRRITRARQTRLAGGAFNLLSGILLAAWSVVSAGLARLERPQELVTIGAYRFSRNPMYLAWAFISSGLALVSNSLWILAALPFAFLYQHFIEIPVEEANLAERFGEEYNRYRQRVHRYL